MPAVPASAIGTSGACQMLLKNVRRGAATLRVGDGRTTGAATDIVVLGTPFSVRREAASGSVKATKRHRIAAALLQAAGVSPRLDLLAEIVYGSRSSGSA